MVNEFGKRGGFDVILQIFEEMAEGTLEVTVHHLLNIP